VYLERRARWWPGPSTRAQLIRDCERIGAWLRAFQSATPVDHLEDLLATREYIDVRLKRLVDNTRARFSSEDRLAVLRAVDLCAAAVTPQERRSVAAHADFAMGNILIDGSRVTVLDFAMGANGLRLHDLSHLYMQLDLLAMKPYFRRQTVSALQRALLAGYGDADAHADPLFRILLTQHRACHYLGLAERPGAALEGLYNARLARAHLAQLRRFATAPMPSGGLA
jgi:aminoglycoside phosphotransferase (APT) family kinase protein